MNTRPFLRLALMISFLFVLAGHLSAQVPQLINYQGRVAVGATAFTGTGQFRFALVNASGSTTYWSNDGTSVAGSQPTTAVPLAVADGLYAVLLGDTTLTNMTAIPTTVFANSDVRLRVWFNDGVNGSQLLTPDQRIAAVGYALVAKTVEAGAITASNIAAGTITSTQLASGAAAANLAASGQSGVPSGGIVLSGNPADSNLSGAGYVILGRTDLGNVWQQHASKSPVSPRSGTTVIWSGTEMIVWGGYSFSDQQLSSTGGRYNPVGHYWLATSTTGAPTARSSHTAVWTGSEMIVWGGTDLAQGYFNTGSRYNPVSDSWSAITTAGAPTARANHTAVWTGSEMIVWGGNASPSNGYDTGFNDGGRYSPASNSWAAVTTTGAPSVRYRHTALWTGSEMIIWGGILNNNTSAFNDGGRYSPASNSWVAVTTTGAPTARTDYTAVWTGSEMFVWGGYGDNNGYFDDGGRYDPANNTWTDLGSAGAPTPRVRHTAVWTGSEMIVWGGEDRFGGARNGASYHPTTNSWTNVAAAGSPEYGAQAVWTGTEMFLWSGGLSNQTYSYTPSRVLYLYQRP